MLLSSSIFNIIGYRELLSSDWLNTHCICAVVGLIFLEKNECGIQFFGLAIFLKALAASASLQKYHFLNRRLSSFHITKRILLCHLLSLIRVSGVSSGQSSFSGLSGAGQSACPLSKNMAITCRYDKVLKPL